MSSDYEDSSTLSFEENVNSKLIQKLVNFTGTNSNSTKVKTDKRRNGVFIAAEDIPTDLEELEIGLEIEDKYTL
jgi:hypothetical protein